MDEILRFMVLRPPEAIDFDDLKLIRLEDPFSAFQNQLRDAIAANQTPAEISRIAQDFIASPNYVSDLSKLKTPLKTFGDVLRQTRPLSLENVNTFIQNIFGKPADQVIKTPTFKTEQQQIADSLIALVIVHQESVPNYDSLVDALRSIQLLRRIAAGDPSLSTPGILEESLEQTVILPESIFPLPPAPSEPAIDADPDEDDGNKVAVEEAKQQLTAVYQALNVLNKVRVFDFIQPKSDVESPQWILSTEAIERLPEETRKITAEMGVALDQTPLPQVTQVLESTLPKLGTQIYTPNEPTSLVRVGSTWLPTDRLIVKALAEPAPINAGAAREIGVADLEVVRQELLRYEAGEIAHIENVLQGEKKERSHRRLNRTEETLFTETESEEESERDLQTAERFELQREAKETAKQETEFDVGVTVKYGGMVSVEASAKFAMKNAKETSSQTASKYAREVTQRTVSKIRERVLERRTRTTVEEIEETNLHGVDNSGGTGHIIGIYRWLDKVYRAQVYNYGLRTMYEFIVPEPAAFIMYALLSKKPEGVILDKPEPFTLNANEITEDNYHLWAKQYNTTDIEPPPQAYITVTKAFAEKTTHEDDGYFVKAEPIPVPAGYRAEYGSAIIDYNYDSSPENSAVEVVIGELWHRKQAMEAVGWWFDLTKKEVETLAVTVKGWGVVAYTVAIEIHCKVTPRARDAWRIKTHAAILRGYLNMKSAYEEQLAAAQINQGIAISGRNPLLNRETEQTELKKGALRLLTRRWGHLGNTGAITSGIGRPDINPARADAQAPIIQFLEQAFEWTQMAYTFYPYYWARSNQWETLQQLDDNDPLYARFLRAGAARLVVPVRPGYEISLRHYWSTGQPWNGQGAPSVTDSAFLPIVDEIREQQGINLARGEGTISVTNGRALVTGTRTRFSQNDVNREIVIDRVTYHIAAVRSAVEISLTERYSGPTNPAIAYSLGMKVVGEPWTVRVPTSLVYLQKDAALPDFTQLPDVTHVTVNRAAIAVLNLKLFNAETGADLFDLTDGMTLNLASLPRFNVRAITNPAAVGSVAFAINDAVVNTDNLQPYRLVAGERAGDFIPFWAVRPDMSYTLRATPYTRVDTEGRVSEGETLTVTINVVNQT